MYVCTYSTTASEDVKEIGKKKSCSFANLLGWVATVQSGSGGMPARFSHCLLCKPAQPASPQASQCHQPAERLAVLLSPALLCRAKNLQGSAKSWPGSDSANDRSPLSRQKDFLHVYVTNTTKMKRYCTR